MSDTETFNHLPEDTSPLLEDTPVTEEPAQPSSDFWQELVSDKRLLYSTIGIIAFVLASIGLIYYFVFGRTPPLPPPDVNLTIQTPQRVIAGQQFDFKIAYLNRSEYALTNVELAVDFPRGFTFKESNPESADSNGRLYRLSDISPSTAGNVFISGILEGEVGEVRDIFVRLRYKAADSGVEFVSEQTARIEIGSSDLVLSVIGPSDVVVGQEVLYNVLYRNVSQNVLRNISINLLVPPEFKITEATPEFDNNNIWAIGDISPGREGSLRFKGSFGTSASLQKVIEVEAVDQTSGQSLSNAFTVTEISGSPVVLSQTLLNDDDGVVLPGETLNYRIDIENRSTNTLTNLVLSTDLVGNAFDFSTLKMTGGVLSGRTITWTPGGVNNLRLLRPGASVKVEFSIDIRDVPTQIGERSMVVVSAPKLSSFELKEPLLGSEVEAKVKTQVDLVQDVVYESGALPMRVGQETRYRITWRLRNTTNLVHNARVTADLPLGPNSYVSGEGLGGTTLTLDSASVSLVWEIGNLDPHTEKSAYFTIAYTPTPADAGGQPPSLVQNIFLEATDSFVGQPVFDETPVSVARPQGRIEP